jgi:peptidoglycan/xylan/chitin deacetylase (PgdA/CDA1 family)
MRVSVIIPAYNEEDMIGRTLESLSKQDYRGTVEIIVVDNGSADGTAGIADSWGVTVVRENRKGYIYALIRGFEHATGEILITTDADTVVPSNWISTLVQAFAEDAEVVAAGGGIEFYDANWKGSFFSQAVLPVALAYDGLCFSYPHMWGANMAVRRSAFVEAGGWTGKFNLHADADLSRRLARIGKVKMLKNLKVSTSARRFNHHLLANLLVYGGNFLGLQFLRRPVFFNFPDARCKIKKPTRHLVHYQRRAVLCGVFFLVALGTLTTLSHAWSQNRFLGGYVKHVETKEKVIALTFDDGPNEPYTSRVLRILRDNDIRATFFLIGENAEFFRDAAKEIAREGHVIGNHSYSHPFLLAVEPSKYEARQIDLSEQVLESVTGVHCTLFRPPRGIYTPWLLRMAARRGITSVGWSEDAGDWHTLPSSQIADKIIKQARPGNIILLHDGLNLVHGIDRSNTVNALPSIIKSLKSQGYRFITVPELLQMASDRSGS